MSTALEEALRPLVAKLVAEELGRRPSNTPEGLRGKKKWTLKELAYRAGVGATTISNLECGKVKHLQHDTLEKIANALGVTHAEYHEAALAVRKVR